MELDFKTYIYKRVHRSGNITWLVRWKNPSTGRWDYSSGWKSEDEAKLAEGEIRRKLFMGVDPKGKQATFKEPPVIELVQLYFESPRFKNASEEWQAAR